MVVIIQQKSGVSTGMLTQDPIFHRPAYTGLLSQAGILLWSAAAAICLLSAFVLRERQSWGTPGRFLLSAGLLTLYLCLDDAFMLHDSVLPGIGLFESFLYVVYLGLILTFLIGFRKHILQTEYLVLAAALVFFGLSIVCDVWGIPGVDPFLLEDGTKIVGIVMWSSYFFRVAASALSPENGGGFV
ncbi:MAG: hypothetical protein JXA36_00755 [Coriobacteriia bacterium]|nr:hypothetical protein [Coriobacteriia bacterium]